MKNKLIAISWRPIIALIFVLFVWEFSTRFFAIETWLLPSPSVIFLEMKEVLPAFLPHMLSTVKLVMIGFVIGTSVGIGMAILLHHFKKVRETIYPFLILSQNIPIIVLAPLLLIWFGLGDAPKIMIIAMTSFFPIAIATLSGLQQTNPELVHYMKMMGASKGQLFFKLQAPHALPTIFSGIKIAATYSVLTGIVAEWLGAQKGIGVFMTLASSSYRTERVFVAIIITMLLSLSFFTFIVLLERIFIKWNREDAELMELSLENISKSFNNKKVLYDISLLIKSGEFVSLLGPSGSGKSTLFSLIGGLLTPDRGNIFLNDEIITNKTGFISYMPQQPSLFPWRTVLDNTILGQELVDKVDKEHAKVLLEKAGLKDFIHAYPHQLSGGMKQRVAFIRALLSPQPIMCLDEPFSALDAFTRLDMQKWLLEMWEAYEQTIFFITHDIEEALFLSDKIIVLSTNPAEIKDIIDVPFNRPRNEELLLSYPFLDMKKEVTNIIQQNTPSTNT